MEDKQLNPDQSVELIRQMVCQTRRQLTFKQGNLFLLWGYLLSITAIVIFILLRTTDNHAWQWLWALPIAIGSVVTRWQYKRNAPQVYSYTDKLIRQIWGGILAVALFAFVHSALNSWSYSPLPIILVVIGTGIYITGEVIHNKYMYYISILVVVLGISQIRDQGFFHQPDGELIAFAIAGMLGLVGSGYALNKQVKRDAEKASENK